MIFHLYNNRTRSVSLTSFFSCWSRRLWHLAGLLKLEFNVYRLRVQGACIASTAVCSNVILHGRHLTIGEFCSVGNIYVQAFGGVTIGNCVVINDGVTLITGSHDPNSQDYRFLCKDIVIRDYAWIAMNVTVLPGVTIGKGAVVGAGSVVTKNVPDYQIVVGNPARRIKERFCLVFTYRPSYWFGPVSAWISRDIFRKT
jgi:acetyltransferase-like isoleucine patch superfamily enzyme